MKLTPPRCFMFQKETLSDFFINNVISKHIWLLDFTTMLQNTINGSLDIVQQ